jgi:hypothetical protein
MATITERHKQALKDVKTLQAEVGEVYDYCGAWCNNDVLDDMLKDPTKKNSLYHLESLISRYFNDGVSVGNNADCGDINTEHPDVYEIGKRYGHL